MAAIEISDDALDVAAAHAHAASLSLADWLTRAITATAADEQPAEALLVDDGGFPSPRIPVIG